MGLSRPESNGIPRYVVDILNNAAAQFAVCATFVPLIDSLYTTSSDAK
jgi:hypothetical protein